MYLPPLLPTTNCQSLRVGNVTVDPSAAIASGVLLQANPDSRIVIKPGVCLGMGVMIHAYEGTLTIEEGANLGAGVMITGQGRVGANACIGATATLINPAIAPGQVIPPGSLMGDTSRQISPASSESTPTRVQASVETQAQPSFTHSTTVQEVQAEPIPPEPVQEAVWETASESPYEPKVVQETYRQTTANASRFSMSVEAASVTVTEVSTSRTVSEEPAPNYGRQAAWYQEPSSGYPPSAQPPIQPTEEPVVSVGQPVPEPMPISQPPRQNEESETEAMPGKVYGQAQLDRLLGKLFPGGQGF